MSTQIFRGKLLAVAGGLLLVAALAPLAAQAEEGFTYRLDPLALETVDTSVDTDSAKLEEYRDWSKGLVIRKLGLFGESADGNRVFELRAKNVARKDARYTINYGVPGKYEILVDYNKIRHLFGNDGHWLFSETSPGRLEIADPVQAALQGSIQQQFLVNKAGVSFPFLNGLLAPYLAVANEVDLGLQRDRAHARVDFGKMGLFSWALDYTHENRTGNRAFGGSFGFNNATEIAEPIDYDTTGAEISGQWKAKSGGVRFGYRYSKFENHVSTLIWDNPFRATDSTDPSAYLAPSSSSINGASRGIFDLAADNDASSVFVDGRARFGGSWWANGSVTYTEMKQDDPLLPYTLNSAIQGIGFNGQAFDATAPANLPARTADRKVDVLNLTGDVGTRFGDSFSLVFRGRYYDYDNKSPRIEFPGYVRFDAFWEEIARVTVPYAYTKQDVGAELGWDLPASSHLGLSFDRESWDRTFREVKSTDENIFKLSFDSHPVEKVSIRASYLYGDKSIGKYDPNAAEASFVEEEGITNLPDLRKLDEAARKHDLYTVQVQLFASDAWSFSFGVTGDNQDFKKSLFGLTQDDSTDYNAEVDYVPSDGLDVFAFFNRTDRTSKQQDRQSGASPSTNPADSWSATLDETTDILGAGFTGKFAKRWSTNLSGQWSRNNGKADLFSPPGGAPDLAVGFGNYDDVKLFSGLARLEYQINKSSTAGIYYRYEDYTLDTFIQQGLLNYLPGALLLNASDGNYTAHVWGVSMTFVF